MRALAPILPHTIEEVYQSAPPALRVALRRHRSFQVPHAAAASHAVPVAAATGSGGGGVEGKSDDKAFDSVFCHGWFHSVRALFIIYYLELDFHIFSSLCAHLQCRIRRGKCRPLTSRAGARCWPYATA